AARLATGDREIEARHFHDRAAHEHDVSVAPGPDGQGVADGVIHVTGGGESVRLVHGRRPADVVSHFLQQHDVCAGGADHRGGAIEEEATVAADAAVHIIGGDAQRRHGWYPRCRETWT